MNLESQDPISTLEESSEEASEMGDSGINIRDFDLNIIPNDFNIRTIFDDISEGNFLIPSFQRNYVWEHKQASRLIESIIIGIPIPQIFLFEVERGRYIVLDGNQRLTTIYYFMKGIFPPLKKRTALAQQLFNTTETKDLWLSENFEKRLKNDNDFRKEYFIEFKLKLPSVEPSATNNLSGKTILTLDEDLKRAFRSRTIRCMVIKQTGTSHGNKIPNSPYDEVVFEIFNRLNSGGTKLERQELRASIYDSEFYHTLYRLNQNKIWRDAYGQAEEDLHLRDVEALLRAFALLMNGDKYQPSMLKFLNGFSKEMKESTKIKTESNQARIAFLENLFSEFFKQLKNKCKEVNQIFLLKNKFSLALFDTIFVTACKIAYQEQNTQLINIPSIEQINQLKEDSEFKTANKSNTTSVNNLKKRFERATVLFQSSPQVFSNTAI